MVTNPSLKYHFYVCRFRDGEHEYNRDAVISCHKDDDVHTIIKEKILATFWGKDTEENDDAYYSPDGSICISIRYVLEISKAHFAILSQYLITDEIEPQAEKVVFS